MNNNIEEALEIRDFLTIKELKWKIEHFNIITGDMGAGKSLCLKLIKYFEDIIPDLLSLDQDDFRNNLLEINYFDYLAKKLTNIFIFSYLEKNNQKPFFIKYTLSYKDEIFEITINGKNENEIQIESEYLSKLLKKWNDYVNKKNINFNEILIIDDFKELKKLLCEDLQKRFNNYFPINATFIPASRAALAFSARYDDVYLEKYLELINNIKKIKHKKPEVINSILKAKKIDIDNKELYIVSKDGRNIPISKASSGQQEIIYLLMHLDKLGNFSFNYGKSQSLFFEEPETHLFPLDQKNIIEYIVDVFNGSNIPIRMFIATHSPYLLNSINNMLMKGALLKNYCNQKEEINEKVNIPHLYGDDVSAFFIGGEGKWENIMDEDKEYLYPEKIADISRIINEDTSNLNMLNNKYINEKE